MNVFAQSLKKLDLSGNMIETVSDVPPAFHSCKLAGSVGFAALINLTSLDLSSNRVILLDGLSSLQRLRHLNLSKNLINNPSEIEKLSYN